MEGPNIQLRTLSPDIQSSRDEQTICVGCYHKTIFPSPIAISDPLVAELLNMFTAVDQN